MLNIPNLATQWGHIFGGVNQFDTFRGTTIKTRADTIAADYTTAATQRLAADGLYQQMQAVDDNLDSTINYFFDFAKLTLAVASLNDSNFPISTDEDTLLKKLIGDMIAQAQTFQLPTVQVGGASSIAATSITNLQGTPFGNGTIVATVIEPRTAVVKYYTYAELAYLKVVADSYKDGAVAGQETFLVQTYSAVDTLDSAWPKGSGVNTTYQSAPSSAGTQLANAYFSTWDATNPNILGSWTTVNLTPGVDIFQTVDYYIAPYSVKLTEAGLNAEIKQDVVAPTSATNYLAAIRVKRPGVVTGGVITVALRDPSGVILNDAAGNPLSFTVALTGAAGAYLLTWKVFPVPRGFTSPMSFSIKMTTAMNAAESVELATVELIPMQSMYTGGPDLGFLPGSIPWADNDQYTFTFTNTAGKASFVKLMDRLYQTRTRAIDLPVAAIPSISDALIV